MDEWVLKQLRAAVLNDIQEFIPDDYFEQPLDELKLSEHLKAYEFLSWENKRGYLAAKLG